VKRLVRGRDQGKGLGKGIGRGMSKGRGVRGRTGGGKGRGKGVGRRKLFSPAPHDGCLPMLLRARISSSPPVSAGQLRERGLWLALLGLLAWIAGIQAFRLDLAEALLLLGPLVAVPLGLPLTVQRSLHARTPGAWRLRRLSSFQQRSRSCASSNGSRSTSSSFVWTPASPSSSPAAFGWSSRGGGGRWAGALRRRPPGV